MPLVYGSGKKARNENVRREIAAGKSPAQATAIAYRVAAEARKKRKGK